MSIKQSVVAITAWVSVIRCSAGSSAVAVPTNSDSYAAILGISASRSRNTPGSILQPHPPPWDNDVRRNFFVVDISGPLIAANTLHGLRQNGANGGR